MVFTSTITKELLSRIVFETFLKFGQISCTILLDSLKRLGFSYATSAGISLSIEDLKVPWEKKNLIATAYSDLILATTIWQEGQISSEAKFKKIVSSWNTATDLLRSRIISYYQNYDPTNSLYMMAFSGARGNISQVRQLVGMRGLMSDQNGNIIDLTIESNFVEGLSTADYVISSYGARKGIVDTALRTADSGYLTRRLIYLAQDLVIRKKDCATKEGIILIIDANTVIASLIGKFLINIKGALNKELLIFKNTILKKNDLNFLKSKEPLILSIRSPLTCSAGNSICQNCYGWDISKNKLISLGDAIGIVAAQSVGEPGTQLTMRTFHTGGTFSGTSRNQTRAPFSGKLSFPTIFPVVIAFTPHGVSALKLIRSSFCILSNWQGKIYKVELPEGSYVYIKALSFLKKGDLINDFTVKSTSTDLVAKPILAPCTGEIQFKNFITGCSSTEQANVNYSETRGILWISPGKYFSAPREAEYLYTKILHKEKPLLSIRFSFPFDGIIYLKKDELKIITEENNSILDLKKLQLTQIYTPIKINFFVKNQQYLDSFTILGTISFFTHYEGKICLLRKKESTFVTSFFIVTEEETWQMHCDFMTESLLFNKKNPTTIVKYKGLFLKKDGLQLTFRFATPILLNKGTLLYCKDGDLIVKNATLAHLISSADQTEDIVQGLPKIEELIEVVAPVKASSLAYRPGVLIKYPPLVKTHNFTLESFLQKGVFYCINKEESALDDLVFDDTLAIISDFAINKLMYLELQISLESTPAPDPMPIFDAEFIKTAKGIAYQEQVDASYTKYLALKAENFINASAELLYSFFEESLLIFRNTTFKAKRVLNKYKPYLSAKWPGSFEIKSFTHDLLINNIPEPWEKEKIFSKNFDSIFIYEEHTLIPCINLNEDTVIFKNNNGDFILFFSTLNENTTLFLEYIKPISEYTKIFTTKIIPSSGDFIDIGEPLTHGVIHMGELLQILFNYHALLDGFYQGYSKGLRKFQLILANSMQCIYQSEGIYIPSRHIEIIVRQMTNKIVIIRPNNSPFLPGEYTDFYLINALLEIFTSTGVIAPSFKPVLLSTTRASLVKMSYIASAGFQETRKVLSKAAVEGSCDWLQGLTECVTIGRIIPAGSAFLNYTSYLDNIYIFKNLVEYD